MKCKIKKCGRDGKFYDEDIGGYVCHSCKNLAIKIRKKGFWGALKDRVKEEVISAGR